MRTVIQRRLPSDRKDIQRKCGVGGPHPCTSVANAIGTIDMVLDGAAAYPSERTSARVLDGLRSLRTSIVDRRAPRGREEHEERRHRRTQQSAEGRDGARGRHPGVAELEFMTEPEILARFTGPIPKKKKKAKTDPS